MNAVLIEQHSHESVITGIFENWGLSRDQRLAFLGCTGKELDAIQAGIPARDAQVEKRIESIMEIDRYLSLAFPCERDLEDAWMNTPNRTWSGRRPADTIVEQGEDGIQKVLTYLKFLLSM